MARNYKNIKVYHLAYSFVLEIYKVTKDFPKSEQSNITSQIRRASVSIPLNIVEGSAKASSKEFLYFLNVAYASAKEVEVLLSLCKDLNYLDINQSKMLLQRLDELNAGLFLFIRTVESKITSKKTKFFQKFNE